ncbi:MAG: hypothetical protein HY860_03890, partial [Chlamydiales bacterium]|nr:hypothetical protein [Chlamydiales bacterium]
KQKKIIEEEAEFLINKESSLLLNKIRTEEFQKIIQSLQLLSAWPSDQFLELYGGDSYGRLVGCARIAFKIDNGWQMLFVREQDGLVFKDQEWKLSDFGEHTKNYPIAVVEKITQEHLELRVWDVSGYDSSMVKINIYTPQSSVVLENVFAHIRQRTLQSISCKMNSKSTILRKGDWVLHTKSGWRVLQSKEDIHSYINYQLEGELFVFDGIDKQRNQGFLLGKLFDATRGEVKAIRLPLIDNNAVAKTSKPAKAVKVQKGPPPATDGLEEELDLMDELY